MVVLYYTTTYYLDVALETIQSIKDKVELHVIIEISPVSNKSTIIDIENLNNFEDIESCEKAIGKDQWTYLKKYFEGVTTVKFLVHKNQGGFSYESYLVAKKLGKYIKRLRPDVVHFDSVTTRCVGLYRYIRSKKIFITIHDPVPHSGEYSWKRRIPDMLFYKIASGYFFYSDFARTQFIKHYTNLTAPSYVIRFQPVTYISQFLGKETSPQNTILFFGRLSPYKGIDILLEAIPKVLERYPSEKFLIAGSPDFDYKINHEIVERYQNNIELVSKYLTTSELMNYLQNAKFVVCPYRDATQSGVLMTSFGAGKAVVATNVGAFPEYIEDNVNGFLTNPDANAVATKIIEALENENYKKIEKGVKSVYSQELSFRNQKCIIKAYEGE